MNIEISTLLLFLEDYESKNIPDNFFVKRFASKVLWDFHQSEGSKFKGNKQELLKHFNNIHSDETKLGFIEYYRSEINY